MKNFFILLSVLGISIPLWSEKLEAASVDKSVIRVNTTMQSYNLIQPWEKGASSTRIGLGAVLPEGKVLVTTQMVTDATYIELEKPDTAAKATATASGAPQRNT